MRENVWPNCLFGPEAIPVEPRRTLAGATFPTSAPMPEPSQNDLKSLAALRAVDFVRDGMRLGLGTGSTATLFVEHLAERVRGGLRVRCVSTPEVT